MKARKPSRKQREAQVLAHLPLVRKEAQRVARRLPAWVDIEDLISAGYLGLLSAVERFDPRRGLSFGAFASHRVKGAILDELRALDPISRRRRRRLRNMEQTRQRMTSEMCGPPTAEQLAERLGLSVAEYQTEESDLLVGALVSLDAINIGQGSLRLADDEKNPPPEATFLRQELRSQLARAIEHLPDRERSVISLYYHRRLAYREIAALYKVTESRICQIHRNAVEHIRRFFEEDLPAPALAPAPEAEPVLH